MGYRSFIDAAGVEWQAWDMVPRNMERRTADRRSVAMQVANERRGATGRRRPAGARLTLASALHAGWLCFETRREKRRLSPIPADWMRCPVEMLEQYLARALPAARMVGSRPGG